VCVCVCVWGGGGGEESKKEKRRASVGCVFWKGKLDALVWMNPSLQLSDELSWL
jgi:hypothetical protein